MQDINPIRKTIGVKESSTPDSLDLRSSVGVNQDDLVPLRYPQGDAVNLSNDQYQTSSSSTPPVINRREEAAFSSLYTPESRRNVIISDTRVEQPIKPIPYKKKGKSHLLQFLIIGIAIIGFMLYTFVFASAKVSITPVRTVVETNKTIIIPSVDIELGSDVATIVSTSSLEKDVPRRGVTKLETKASGIIVISNSFDQNPQKLITNTRFESKTGKIYKISESVTVPGMKAGVPGTVEATVYADSVGADYNTESAVLSIPGFKGTKRYDKFSAVTKNKFSGGASGEQSAVADEDIVAARSELKKKMQESLQDELKNKNPGDEYVYIQDATKYTEADNKSALATDAKAKYRLDVVTTTYYVKKTYLSKKILEGTNNASQDLRVEDVSKIVFGKVPEGSEKNPNDIAVTVNGSPSFIADIDTLSIASALQGKSKSEFSNIMAKFSGVDKAEPHFNPFWIRTFPGAIKKINIEIVK